MKVFGIEIGGNPEVKSEMKELNTFENLQKMVPRAADVIREIRTIQLHRQRQDILNWRLATTQAESVFNPNRTELVRIYKDVVLDAHLSSLIQTINLKLTGSDYWICDQEGEENEEATELTKKEWFTKLIEYIISAKHWGYSYVQLGKITDEGFESIELIPYEYGLPEKKSIKKSPNITGDTIPVWKPPYNNWVLFFGERKDLGLLHKATPYVLWKKNTMQAWGEFADKFGMPIRIGKTNIQDPKKKENMDNMMDTMGKGLWATIDNSDMIELLQTTSKDAYNVYKEFIDTNNKELSKLFVGQTMTTEDGSSRAQAEVHENLFKDIITGYKQYVTDAINTVVIPVLERHGLISPDLVFKFDTSEQITMLERLEMVTKLSQYYNVDTDFIMEEFDIPVTTKQATAPEQSQELQNIVDYYENAINSIGKGCDHGEN